MNSTQLVWLGLLVVFIGFFVVFAGAFLGSGGSTSSGGFILIGPIPIIFGSGPNSGALASVALVISVIIILFYFVSFFMRGWGRRREGEVETESE